MMCQRWSRDCNAPLIVVQPLYLSSDGLFSSAGILLLNDTSSQPLMSPGILNKNIDYSMLVE